MNPNFTGLNLPPPATNTGLLLPRFFRRIEQHCNYEVPSVLHSILHVFLAIDCSTAFDSVCGFNRFIGYEFNLRLNKA